MKTRLIFALIMVAAVFFNGCGGSTDLRYDKWGRYQDQDDGYLVLVPPGWSAEGDTIRNFRGTRFTGPDSRVEGLAYFVYFGIYVRDIEDPAEEVDYAKIVEQITDDGWLDLKIQSSESEIGGHKAAKFDMSGKPHYTEFTLKGTMHVMTHGGKVWAFFASATTNSFKEMEYEFELIRESIKLP